MALSLPYIQNDDVLRPIVTQDSDRNHGEAARYSLGARCALTAATTIPVAIDAGRTPDVPAGISRVARPIQRCQLHPVPGA